MRGCVYGCVSPCISCDCVFDSARLIVSLCASVYACGTVLVSVGVKCLSSLDPEFLMDPKGTMGSITVKHSLHMRGHLLSPHEEMSM